MSTITVEWSQVRWYRVMIDRDDPALAGLTVADFPVSTEDLSYLVHEVLGGLESDPRTTLWHVDGVEIGAVRPVTN